MLMEIKTDNAHYIKLSISDDNPMRRFPNHLLWDINSYLSKQYKLYEYYRTRKTFDDLETQLLQVPMRNKSLYFSKLDKSYISMINHTEKEMKEEFEKHRDEVKSYEAFCELYSMEQIDELNYIATGDLQEMLRKLKTFVRSKCFVHYKKILQKIEMCSEVSIHIGDHCYMHIKANNPEIIKKILYIIRFHEKTAH